MPLARILTLLPEDATPLSQELKRMGFAVEVANPNQEQLTPADLEIEFAIGDQQQVLARAAAIAAQLQAEVVVFPGAIPPLPKPAPVIAEVPVAVSAPSEVATPQQPLENRPPEHKREFGLQLPAGTWFTGVRERLRPVLGTWLTRLRTGISTTGSAVAGRTREYQQRIQARLAEAQAARKQRLAEIERQRAEAAQRTVEQQHAGAENIVAAQQQFQAAQAEREKRLAEMERLRAEAREQVAVLERARLAAEAEYQKLPQQPLEPGLRQRLVQNLRPQSLQLRGVFMGAAAASILFIVGILLANFHPATPLPVSITNGGMEQQVPFGATTVHGAPGVTVGGGKTPRPAPAIKNPQPPAPQLKPQPPKPSAQVTKKNSQWQRFQRKSNNGIADDVVVRHFGPTQKPIAKNTQPQAGLKHYSDQ